MKIRIAMFSLLVACVQFCVSAAPEESSTRKVVLSDGWSIQPSTEVQERGDVLSTVQFQPKHWYAATVPSTVVAALVADHVYADPYFGMNLRSISGTSYPIGTNFSNVPMPPGSAFRSPWWYRTQFSLPAGFQGKRIQLHFDGINFRANVWLNGKQIANAREMAGAWRLFEFDVTDTMITGAPNALAVEVYPPTPEDLAITFVDWNPAPPDKGMGIWRDVYLTSSGPVTIRFPQVMTKLDLPALDKAHLTVTAELRNATKQQVSGMVRGQIDNVQFSQPVTLGPEQMTVIMFAPGQFQQLNLTNPRLWWPVQTGPQNLYRLRLQFESAGVPSDETQVQFGVREITSELTGKQQSGTDSEEHLGVHRLFKVNGKNVLIRGAGYSFDMLLRDSPERQEAELKYVRDMNLNTVRLEGKIVDDHFLELADQYGILITAGWCCCDHWEQWKRWDDEDHLIAAESLKDQIRRLRTHPAVFNWMNGSDNPPPPDVERMYVGILKELNWPNPYESSATAKPTTVTGDTGVKMTGPYGYVAPSYWLLDSERGGAHGFNTETSPGAAVPPLDSLRRMLPEDHLWPINTWWDFHAGGGVFRNINVFTKALNARYGTATSVEDFAMKAQVMEYEGERAMFEAFGRNKYVATGVIQWMLNNAWPSIIWHLYDYYLRPGGGYFGTKKACEPLHIQYSYDDRSVAVVNSYYNDFKALKASAKVYNLDLTEKYSHEVNLDIAADGVRKVFVIPKIERLSSTYFVRLSLEDASGKVVSSNLYWLSTAPETLDWGKSTWYYTPTKSFADLKALGTLPRVQLRVASRSKVEGDQGTTLVTVENATRSLAFFVHLKMMKSSRTAESPRTEILPVLWQDNYFPLMPGEKRQIAAAYAKADAGRGVPTLDVEGWNVIPETGIASNAASVPN
jgi:exo-1,4-beta-D-glucosaminidase